MVQSGKPNKKSIHIEICKKSSTQPDSNPWWTRLTHGFQPILTSLLLTDTKHEIHKFWKRYKEYKFILKKNENNGTSWLRRKFGSVKKNRWIESDEYITRSETVAKKATTPFTRAGPRYFLLFLFLHSMWTLPPTFAPVNHTPPTSISSNFFILILLYLYPL